jgi:hypothetical protein
MLALDARVGPKQRGFPTAGSLSSQLNLASPRLAGV